MVSTVKARPNHYETLGIEPTASEEEIARAFQRRMLAPSAADMARIGPAFATLRDPAKRLAYDEAIGLRREPASKPRSPGRYSFSVSVSTNGFIGSAARAEPQVEPAPIEPDPQTLIEAEPVVVEDQPRERVVLEAPGSQPESETEADRLRAKLGVILATDRPREPREAEPDERPPEWKRFGLAGGGVVLAVALIGAWAGMKTSAATDPQRRAQVASLLLPPPTTFSVDDSSALGPAPGVGGGEPQRAAATSHGSRRTERRARAQRQERSEDRLAGISQSLQDPYYSARQPEAAIAPAAQPAKVSQTAMPLPNNVIARTLHRIGYGCGSVASTTPADSAGGYTVTCTSGHSYSAKPVRGRYHFRRL